MNDAEMLARHKERKAMTASEKTPVVPKMNVAKALGFDEMFTKRWRERECGHCGQVFVQRELSPKMVAWIAALPAGARALWAATVTENALPLFCVTCERREMSRVDARVPAPRENAA